VIILTDHSAYNFPQIVEAAKLVVDTRNATKELQKFKDRIIKLGAGSGAPSMARHDEAHEIAALEAAVHS